MLAEIGIKYCNASENQVETAPSLSEMISLKVMMLCEEKISLKSNAAQ